jgi:hypothetical protein
MKTQWNKFTGEWEPVLQGYFTGTEEFINQVAEGDRLPISDQKAIALERTGKESRNPAPISGQAYRTEQVRLEMEGESYLADLLFYPTGLIEIQRGSDL